MHAKLRKDRIVAAAGAVLLEGALLYALLTGLWTQSQLPDRVDSLILFDVIAPNDPVPPPPPPLPEIAPAKAPEGHALRSQATPVAAPEPAILLPPVQPIIAAPAPSTGRDAASGTGDTADPAGGDQSAPARRVMGSLSDHDYPRWASRQRVGGLVVVRYSVETDGRVGACDIAGSSGNAALDAYTCRLVRRRYRFTPMRDRSGKAVRSYVQDYYTWVLRDQPAAE